MISKRSLILSKRFLASLPTNEIGRATLCSYMANCLNRNPYQIGMSAIWRRHMVSLSKNNTALMLESIKQVQLKQQYMSKRSFSSSNNSIENQDIDFDKFSPIVRPNPFRLLGTTLQIFFQMKLIDTSFKLAEFRDGSLQAVLMISDMISRAQTNDLKSILHPKLYNLVKQSIDEAKEKRQSLNVRINKSDIGSQTPMRFHTQKLENGNTLVFIEMLYYVLPDAQQHLMELSNPMNMGDKKMTFRDFDKYMTEKLQLAHYVFAREYGSNVENSSWLVVYLRHYSADEIRDL